MSDTQLPQWAAKAMDLFKVLSVVYAVLWLMRAASWLINLIFDANVDFSPQWLDVVRHTLGGIAIVCLWVWLAGPMVARYREPKVK